MAAQVPLTITHPSPEVPAPAIELPSGFQLSSQNRRLRGDEAANLPPPPLGVLENFKGSFAGTGFNTIFRPDNLQTKFPKEPAPGNIRDNVLELNLTKETLTFSASLGQVPNRGLGSQPDIMLNGVPYVQSISDVTNIASGKGDNPENPIHFEPGLWMHVPETKNSKLFP